METFLHFHYLRQVFFDVASSQTRVWSVSPTEDLKKFLSVFSFHHRLFSSLSIILSTGLYQTDSSFIKFFLFHITTDAAAALALLAFFFQLSIFVLGEIILRMRFKQGSCCTLLPAVLIHF